MAAHLEGSGATVLDMTGLAQKGGAVTSHVRLAGVPRTSTPCGSPRAAPICCSAATSWSPAASKRCHGCARARHAWSSTATRPSPATSPAIPTSPSRASSSSSDIRDLAGAASAEFIDATGIAERLLGDSIGANLFLLGFACRRAGAAVARGDRARDRAQRRRGRVQQAGAALGPARGA